jgi:hypothetical protein
LRELAHAATETTFLMHASGVERVGEPEQAGRATRRRALRAAGSVDVICENCWRVRLQVREREVIAQSYAVRAKQRGRGRR